MQAKTTPQEIFQIKTSKIYKNKELNNANFGDFNHNDYQVFLYLISKIGGVDKIGKYLQPEQLQRECTLTAKEYSELFEVSLSNCYGLLKKAVDKLMKTDIRIKKTDGLSFWRINVCSQAEYNQHKGSITIEFTDRIMPYLTQVKQRFVLYNLKEISKFRSLYTIRLYELIQEFKETGWLLKSVEQLREIFAVGDKFSAYKDFKKHTFARACQEINTKYDMNLSFEELKKGRRFTAVKFTFKPIISHKVTDQYTGIERNIYEKPKALPVTKKRKEKTLSEVQVLEGQLAFDSTKSIKNTLNSLLSKINPFK